MTRETPRFSLSVLVQDQMIIQNHSAQGKCMQNCTWIKIHRCTKIFVSPSVNYVSRKHCLDVENEQSEVGFNQNRDVGMVRPF